MPVVTTRVVEIPQAGFSPTPGFSTLRTTTVREVKVSFPNVSAPVTAGQVQGTIYEDANVNGVLDLPAEELLEGWTVYIDYGNNATFDVGEPNTHTDVNGDNQFTGVPTGSVIVYEVPQNGMLPVVPGLFPLAGASDHRSRRIPNNH